MFKLIIADDEPMVRFTLKSIVSQNFPNITVVGEASTGNEVITMSDQMTPDILLMDIKMPGMNGIEASKKIKNKNANIHIILITAYDTFDYMQDALKFGADDYLLKPFSKEKIINVINETIIRVENQREKIYKIADMEQQIDKARPFIESLFISSSVFSKIDTQTVKFLEMLHYQGKAGYVMVINTRQSCMNSLLPSESIKAMQKLYEKIYKPLHQEYNLMISMPFADNLILYVDIVDDMECYNLKMFTLRIAETIYSISGKQCMIGIGRIYKGIENLMTSYKEAIFSLSHATDEEYILFYDEINIPDNDIRYPVIKEEHMIASLKLGQYSDAVKYMDDIFAWLLQNLPGQIDIVRSIACSIAGQIIRVSMEILDRVTGSGELFMRNYYLEIMQMQDSWTIKQLLETMCEQLSESIRKRRKNSIVKAIEISKKFILLNFNKNITMNDVAKEVCLSPQHFCRLFKKELQENFTDYITRIRIDAVKKLLGESSLSIKEICFKTGFNDSTYFVKVFKKHVGMTPSEFRKAN